MTNNISFSKEAENIIELIQNTDENLFVTGKAGTGKSTLLEYIAKQDHSIIVLAPTGIAAINVKGETIHSFFRLKPGYELDEAKHVTINDRIRARYTKIHTVIIDEISMVRADLLDAIDIFLQRTRRSTKPFGGVRMIFFGDLFQLPPVLLNQQKEEFLRKYKSPYFFSAHTFIQRDLFSEAFKLRKCELRTIYRQKDPVFTNLLNSVRENRLENSQLQLLNQQVRVSPTTDNQFQINLVSTNAIAKSINLDNLKLIKSEEKTFTANHTGNIENLQPNDPEVILKVGAQVMFLNNDPNKRWVNGTVGKITAFGEGIDEETNQPYPYVAVELEDGHTVKAAPFTWEISKYSFKAGNFEREQIGTYTQIPLKLAWAITIHKSQGKTFNKVKINLGRGSFAHGQTYVALSRCRTLENIALSHPIKQSDIIVDQDVLNFINS
ncbi:ATP-dependent DNA helicase [Sediminitomix flava]|uniref:PIF1-like helicase n=1 Tax=Sediminitomix flava TaxID=379075 RepID=A0A315Z8I5_SEDFL|nr:DEAD/DEAH box helicase [Sediminitomix flava]PWJ40749.1 PIF1-like helicase [Sediminitomix flava]